METDSAVATEAVAPPPVQISTVARPPGRRRVGGRMAGSIALIGAVAVGAVAWLGFSLNQELSATRSTLASAQKELGRTRTSLDGSTAELAATRTNLEAATAEQADLDATIEDLSGQVASQTECVRLQRAALDELVRIAELQTVNFNRTAQGSSWDTAEKRRTDGITAALDEFYAAYSAAFEGSLDTARTHADRGKAAQANIADAERQLLAELHLVDMTAAEIEGAIDALEAQLTKTEATCEGAR